MTMVSGIKASEVSAIADALLNRYQENKKRPEKNVDYYDIVINELLLNIPLDAKSFGLRAISEPDNKEELAQLVYQSLICCVTTLNDVSIVVPFDSQIDKQSIFNFAEGSSIDIVISLPEDPNKEGAFDAYCNLLKAYTELWAKNQSSIQLYPTTGYIQYLMGKMVGYTATTITNDDFMQSEFTDSLSIDQMNKIKWMLDEVIEKHLGEDIRSLMGLTVQAIKDKREEAYLSSHQYLIDEVDMIAPVPDLVRVLAETTTLDLADSLGYLFELSRSFFNKADKYFSRDGQSYPIGLLSTLVISVFGDKDALLQRWTDIASLLHHNQKDELSNSSVKPNTQLMFVANALSIEPVLLAKAAADVAFLIEQALITFEILPGKGVDKKNDDTTIPLVEV
ncbi:MAG: hypothetical protein V3T17_09190 [Pseudomonadales bacterium]